MNPIVRLEHVDKAYAEAAQRRQILRELLVRSLSVRRLHGHPWAQRQRQETTLLNLLAGIDQPTAGHIYIADVCLTRLSARARTLFRRDQLGFVFQFFNLIPTLTVLENILLPAELAGRADSALRAAARALLERVGLADRADTSSRISSPAASSSAWPSPARWWASTSALVLADEPTGNLDERTGAEVMDLLDEMTRRAGRALIMVTHSHQIAALADTVVTIQDRQLVVDPQVKPAVH